MALNKWDKQHLLNLGLTQRQIDSIFDEAVKEAAAIGVSLHDINPDRPFDFADYPITKARIEKLLKKLQNNIETAVVNGVRSAWTLANNKNSALCDRVFGDNKSKLTKEQERKYYSNNDKALEAFIKRKTAGLNLSDRVWSYTDGFKNEIEMGLDLGIRNGLSAAEMARDLKQYLREPDRLFRRVRDEHGQLHLSKAAKAYNPGAGHYRSSYKNAMRLARTENNMAYRTADYERWQRNDSVVGIEIRLSNNHTLNGKPFTDICDELAGKYPKTFKFTGWHPQCRCFAIPVMKTQEELKEDYRKIENGEETDNESVNKVKDVPEGFKKWVAENKGRIEAADKRDTLPYFLRDNRKLWEFGQSVKPEKSDTVKAGIQARWDERKKQNARIIETAGRVLSVSKTYHEVDTETLKQLMLSGSVKKIQAETRAVAKAIAEVRKDDRYLSALIPDVRKWKQQFTSAELHQVYNSTKAKIAAWENLTLEQQLKKVDFELDYVLKNKKYSTWEVAHEVYKKRLAEVEYLIDKGKIQESVSNALSFAVTTNSTKIKKLAKEMNLMFSGNESIGTLKAKASALNKAVALAEKNSLSKTVKQNVDADMKNILKSYTPEEKEKYKSLLLKYHESLFKSGNDLFNWEVESARLKLTEYVHSLSEKYHSQQKSVLSANEVKKAEIALKNYLAEKPINPNYIFGSEIGGVYQSLKRERELYAKTLGNVTPEELSLITRFTNGSTFSNAYNLKDTSSYWRKVWEDKTRGLKPDEIKKIERIIEEYTKATNGVINKLRRYDSYVYRGVKNDGAAEMIDEFNRVWNSKNKVWINPNHASSSTHSRVALGFDDSGKNDLIIVIKNKTGGYIAAISEYNTEFEVLLMKGAKYKMKKAPYMKNGKTFVELTEI